MPHFDYKGGIFCGMAAFKAHCTFRFWLGSLLKIETKLDKAMGQFGCITTQADLPSDKEIADLIWAAMQLHDAGTKLSTQAKPAVKSDIQVPDYFLAAIKKNKRANEVFVAFSPSKKREYVEWIVEAKTEATRERRLKRAVDWMSEGKVKNWKYIKSLSANRPVEAGEVTGVLG